MCEILSVIAIEVPTSNRSLISIYTQPKDHVCGDEIVLEEGRRDLHRDGSTWPVNVLHNCTNSARSFEPPLSKYNPKDCELP